jgi:hypothetical protein
MSEKMNRPGDGTDAANRSEEYEHASWSRSHDLRHPPPPGGVSAHSPHQEAMHQAAILAGYSRSPSSMQGFSTAQLPPPAMPVGGAYFPPTGGAQNAMIADFLAFQKAEAAKTLKENQSKEASLYEQLGRATAAASSMSFPGAFPRTQGSLHAMQVAQQSEALRRTLRENQSRELLMYAQLEQAKKKAAATTPSFPGAVPGRFPGAPFQYQGISHLPPPSAAYATIARSVTPPESTNFHTSEIAAAPYFGGPNFHTGGISAAPYPSLPPYQPELNAPQGVHRNISSPPGASSRYESVLQRTPEPAPPVRHASAVAAPATARTLTKGKPREKKTQPKKKLCRYYLKSSKVRNYSYRPRADQGVAPNETLSADA